MSKFIKIFAVFLMMFIVFTISPIPADADFGDFSGDSDYGGSDYSSSDYGSSSYDSDYGSSGSGGFDPISGAITLIVVIIATIYILISNKTKKPRNMPPGATPTPRTNLMPVDAIKQWDPAFSESDVKQNLSNLYVQMQNGWTAKDISALQGDFTDEQFAQYDRQLQAYRDKGQTNITERIAVLDVRLVGCAQDATNDILVVNISTRIVSYVVDDRTKAVVSGDPNKEKFMVYEYTLIRPKGSKTVTQSADTTFNCPNCGAAININQSAKCPYCDSIIKKADYDWVISGIKGISQRTS